MKIGFVLDDGLDAPDGVQQYVLTLGKWFVSRGHEVHYLVGQTVRDDIPNIHSLSKNVSVSFNHNRLSIPFSGSRSGITELLRAQQFDVLHVQLPYSPQLAGKVISLAEPTTAIIGTFHILPYGKLQTTGSKLLSKVLSPTLKKFSAIAAVSEAAQEFASRVMGIDSVVIPNAVNLAGFTAGKKLKKFDDGKQNIVFLGRLVERKGCMQLLKAVQRLHDQDKLKDVRVIVAGHGPELPKIEEYIQKYYLQDHVVLAGWLTEAEKPDYLRSADIAVMPSIAGESFGIVLVEAIAAGAGVVLGGDNPGYRYVLENEPLALIDPNDTAAFADRLAHLLRDTKLRSKIRTSQLERIKDFDVNVVGKQLEKLYTREIANNKPTSDNTNHEQE